MNNILLTGASGFLGKAILRYLLSETPFRVTIIVRNPRKIKEEFKNNQKIKVIKTEDLFAEEHSWWVSNIKDISHVIHCAWYVNQSDYLYSFENYNSLQGTLKIANFLSNTSIKKFIGIGTCFEYDIEERYLSTSTALKPETPYSACKVAAYIALKSLFRQKKIDFNWARVFFLYGDGESKERLVPYIKKCLRENETALLTSGLQIRDFIEVNEAARQICGLIDSSAKEEVNICSGIGVTVKDFVKSFVKNDNQLKLLKFGAKENKHFDPDIVVGVKDD